MIDLLETRATLDRIVKAMNDVRDRDTRRRLALEAVENIAALDPVPVRFARLVTYLLQAGNATTTSAEETLALAEHALDVAGRCEDAADLTVVGWTSRAFEHATEFDDCPDAITRAERVVTELADSLEKPHPGVDSELAAILRNQSVEAKTLSERHAIAERMRELATRHPKPVQRIEEQLAAVLANIGGYLDKGDPLHIEIVREITNVRARQPDSPEVAGAFAMSVWNAFFAGLMSDAPDVLAARIADAAAQLKAPVALVDYCQARLLYHAVMDDAEWDDARHMEDLVRALAERHTPPNAQIDLIWAQVVASPPTKGRPVHDRQGCEERLAAIAVRHIPPNRDIDAVWAQSMVWTDVEDEDDLGQWQRAAERVAAVSARHDATDDPEDALMGTLALCQSNVDRLVTA